MISLILPIYNVQPFLKECLDSILCQTYKDFELIAVDDCGTDDSMAIVGLYEDKLLISIVRHVHNRGLSAARNSGLEVAKGEYILFVDSDDILAPDCLEKLVAMADKSEAEMVVGNVDCFGVESNCVPRLVYDKNVEIEGRDNALMEYLQGKYYMMAWNKLIRKDFLVKNDIQFVEGLVHEDNPWALQVAAKAEKIAMIPDVTYHYRIREGSLQTDKNFDRHFQAYCQIISLVGQSVAGLLSSGFSDKEYLRYWFERQKAVLYGSVVSNGTEKQQEQIYTLVHDTLPQKKFDKYLIHYMLPKCIGKRLYDRLFGVWLI
ncbi:MAG: glycosyltransferase [Bacteroidales bacterium]|nr:glycosyltransferase [Bacteroidales bacterium]